MCLSVVYALLQGFVYKTKIFRPQEKAWLGLAEVG